MYDAQNWDVHGIRDQDLWREGGRLRPDQSMGQALDVRREIPGAPRVCDGVRTHQREPASATRHTYCDGRVIRAQTMLEICD